jgi:hypothetical protein
MDQSRGKYRPKQKVKLRRITTRRQEEIGRRRKNGVDKVTGEMMEGVRGSNGTKGEINGEMKQWE